MLKKQLSLVCVFISFGVFLFSCKSVVKETNFTDEEFIELKEFESSELKVVLECDTLNFAFNLNEKIILLEGYCPYKEYSSNEKLKEKRDCNFYYDINLKKVLYHHNKPSFAFNKMLKDSTFSYYIFKPSLLKFNKDLSKKEVYKFDFDSVKMNKLDFFKNVYVGDDKLFSSIKVSEKGIKDRDFVKTIWRYLQNNKIVKIAPFYVSDNLCAVRTESDEVFIVQYDEKAIGWDKNEILSDYNENYTKRYNKKSSKIKLKKVGYKLDQINEKRFMVHDYYKFSHKSMSFLFKITTDTDNVENFRLFLEDHPTYRLEDFDHIELINEQPTPNGEFFIYDKLTNRLFSIKFK
jgi:hypothetical protein